MTEFKWFVERLTVIKNYENQEDVVAEASWGCRGEEIVDDKTYDSTWFSQTRFTINVSENFTPFDQLTESQVLNWIWSSGVIQSEIENNVQIDINAKKAPPIFISPGPWKTEQQ